MKNTQKGFAKIWFIVGLVVIAVISFIIVKQGCWIAGKFYFKSTCESTGYALDNSTADWKTYRNTGYGFEITFTDAWKGYQVELQPMSSNFGAGTLIFKFPTTKNYGDGSGYAEPLKIHVYNHEYWNKLQKEEGPKPGLLGRTFGYIFAYSAWQDPPAEFVGKDFGFDIVITSFKFTK